MAARLLLRAGPGRDRSCFLVGALWHESGGRLKARVPPLLRRQVEHAGAAPHHGAQVWGGDEWLVGQEAGHFGQRWLALAAAAANSCRAPYCLVWCCQPPMHTSVCLVVIQLQAHAVVDLVVCKRDVVLHTQMSDLCDIGGFCCIPPSINVPWTGWSCRGELCCGKGPVLQKGEGGGAFEQLCSPCRCCTTSGCESSRGECRFVRRLISSGHQ